MAVGRRRGLVSSASLTLATRIAAFGFSLITNIILARSLGPDGRGIYAVAVLVPAIVSLLAQLGIGPANVYFVSKRILDPDELVGHSLALALLLGTLCLGILLGYALLTGAHSLFGIEATYIIVTALSLPFSLFTAFLQGLLQGVERFAHYNAVLLVQYASPALCLFVALVIVRAGAMGAVASWTAAAIITAMAALYSATTVARISVRLRRSTLSQLLRFGMISYLGSVTSFVNYRFDVLIVNLFAGTRQVGLYAVGTGLAEVVWYLANAAGIVLAPRVASTRGEEGDRITAMVCRVVTLLAIVFGGLLAVAAPFVVVLFFGEAFAESAWAVWLLLPGIITFSVARVLSMYLLGRNRLRVDMVASIVGLVVTLALDLILIPRYGFRGAAVASTIAYTCTMAVDLRWVVRNSTMSLGDMLIARPSDVRLLIRRMMAMRVA